MFPISRDPPAGGTGHGCPRWVTDLPEFPISRDPPEGGTTLRSRFCVPLGVSFQFLGIPPKGELECHS